MRLKLNIFLLKVRLVLSLSRLTDVTPPPPPPPTKQKKKKKTKKKKKK